MSQLANKAIDNFKAERDTRLRNYVMLHPELFPKPGMDLFDIIIYKRK